MTKTAHITNKLFSVCWKKIPWGGAPPPDHATAPHVTVPIRGIFIYR